MKKKSSIDPIERDLREDIKESETALGKLKDLLNKHYVALAMAGVGKDISYATRQLEKHIESLKNKKNEN